MQRRDFMLKTAASLALGSLAATGCTTSVTPTVTPATGSSSEKRRREIEQGVDATLTRLYSNVPDARDLVAKASGVLVFPNVLAAGFGIGGQYGEGALRVHSATVAHYSLASVSVGLQIGAQSKAIIFLFMAPEVLDKFRKSEGWTVGVDASAAILKVGANGKIDANSVTGPVLAFVLTNAGLMANLTLEGTKISRLKV
jgi:lipid-binding SYLF domain-containing protein